MNKVKSITISNPEGRHEYCNQFPKTFNSFEEANAFLQANSHYHAEGGYDKHNISVEWEGPKQDVYAYRGDIASPKGNCYSSIEYNIDQRVKQGMLFYIEAYENGDRFVAEESYKDLSRMVVENEMSSLSKEELKAIQEADNEIAKSNDMRIKIEEAVVEFEEHKASLIDDTHVEPAKKEFSVDYGWVKVRYSKEYIVIEGGQTEKHPKTLEDVKVPFRMVLLIGAEDVHYGYRYYHTGSIKAISANSVLVESSSNKRVKIENFVKLNAPDSLASKKRHLDMIYYR